MDCASCGRELPASNAGRPRKYHSGACEIAGRRVRRGVQKPRADVCRLCGDPVAPGRLYYCGADCAERYERMNMAERTWLAKARSALDADVSTWSAAEILPVMSPLAVRWRQRRAERLGHALAA